MDRVITFITLYLFLSLFIFITIFIIDTLITLIYIPINKILYLREIHQFTN